MKNIIIILMALVCAGCGQTTNNKQSANISDTIVQNVYLQMDTISDMIIYKYYSYSDGVKNKEPDSTIYFFGDSKRTNIHYHKHPEGILRKNYSATGNLYSIYFSCDNPKKGDTVSIFYFENGTIHKIQTIEQDSFLYPQLFISYYANGNKAGVGICDMYGVVVVPCGTWHTYDSIDGRLMEEETFFHYVERGRPYTMVTTYDKKGRVATIKRYNDYVLTEDFPIELDTIPE